MSLTDHAQEFVAMQASPETRRAYERDLTKWFDFAGAAGTFAVTAQLVTDWKRELELGLSPNSAARTWSTVRGYYKFLSRKLGKWEPTAFDYVKGPKRPTGVTPKVPTDEDVDRTLEGARDNPLRQLVLALLLNGLRAGEVCALRKADVEKHDSIGTVLRVRGKGMKERLVPATVETELALTRWAWHSTSETWLLCGYDGSPLTVRQVEHAVYKSAEYAGVEDMHPHALRHHYATRLIRAGASPLHVSQLLGHASVATTQVYVTLDLADLAKAAQLDPRNQPAQPVALEAAS